VSKAPPDGYTLLGKTDTLTSMASMYKKTGYDVSQLRTGEDAD